VRLSVTAGDCSAKSIISEMVGTKKSPAVTDSRTEAHDYAARLTNIYEQLAAKKYLLAGIREDFSVTHYFELKATFKVPKFNVHVYAGDKKAKQKLPIKNAHLYQDLVTLRNELCQELNVPVYMVADTKMLVEVSNSLPQTPEELMRIKGFGKMKV
jgi:superfamily II DNA helicase RecQ